eukprot:TRINITY_DN11084_c0_g1_i1.p1 TRINITY_DN11084_c0_g1~~TRINITY_DN11084_c0_g1_i1.p1  ORF type:complete len:397 (-),score=58.89 TRINITY_DN11084_c0_g1_i1:151-1245(-)
MTAYKVACDRLQKLNEYLRNVKLGDFTYVDESMKLGELGGNHFQLIIRSVTADDELITQSIKSIKDRGFINYFGLQRFGTSAVSTHSIGRACLRSDWKEAVQLILKPRPGESEEITRARDVFANSGNAAEALELMPWRMHVERTILEALANDPDNYLAALSSIQRNLRTLYGHSYQSLIWNTAASKRIQLFGGDNVVVGDIVFDNETPHILTQQDVESGKYSIEDVVLPIPGYSSLYPGNELKQFYVDLLAKDQITTEMFRHSVRDFKLQGGYRKLIERPRDVTYEILRYSDPDAKLNITDFDRLQPEPVQIYTDVNGPLKAARFTFTLASSTYATMCLREIFNMPTDFALQNKLYWKDHENKD